MNTDTEFKVCLYIDFDKHVFNDEYFEYFEYFRKNQITNALSVRYVNLKNAWYNENPFINNG